MRFNLIEERWIPVIRADGSRETIAPWELTGGDPPIADLHPPRPDFRAALLELLIGLVQTALPPEGNQEWKRLLGEPPAPDTLRAALAPHAAFFNLFGDKPLFQQDFELEHPEKDKDCTPIAALLIDSPGAQGIRRNTDFFIKRGNAPALCPACVAMALHTMQAFAPSGGAGHRVSLRGGGPLSTLADGSTLWEKVWLNVLPTSATSAHGVRAPGPDELPGRVYPWGAPTRVSTKGEQTHLEDGHFLQHYWGMPRRILLRPEQATPDEPCAICAATPEVLVRRYSTRPHGTNYGDTWRHPLTPYRDQGQDKPHLSIKGSASFDGYGHWLGIVYGQGAEKGVRCAACVGNALYQLEDELAEGTARLDVAVAGYDMDNMKARQWCESRFPYYPVPQDALRDFRTIVDMLVLAADAVRKNLQGLLKEALVNEAGRNQAKADKTLFDNAATAFWGRTEAAFYPVARQVAATPDLDATDAARERWANTLVDTAHELFRAYTQRGRIKPERMERIVEAGRKLDNYNRKKVRTVLALPETGGNR